MSVVSSGASVDPTVPTIRDLERRLDRATDRIHDLEEEVAPSQREADRATAALHKLVEMIEDYDRGIIDGNELLRAARGCRR